MVHLAENTERCVVIFQPPLGREGEVLVRKSSREAPVEGIKAAAGTAASTPRDCHPLPPVVIRRRRGVRETLLDVTAPTAEVKSVPACTGRGRDSRGFTRTSRFDRLDLRMADRGARPLSAEGPRGSGGAITRWHG